MDRGIDIVFGCDVPCHVASDTLGQLRAMFYVQGFLDGAMERSFAVVSTRRPAVRKGMPLLTPRELLRIATIQTARVFGMDERIGSLTPGKRADILLVRKGPFGDSIEPDACAACCCRPPRATSTPSSSTARSGCRRARCKASIRRGPRR